MRRRRVSKESLILPIVAALVLLADQITKRLVAARLAEGQSWEVAPWLTPIFLVTHVTNTGGAFGLFPGLSDILVIVAVIVIAAIVIYYRHLPEGQVLIRIALGFQLGGAAGNLVDRLRQGFVVDFIDLNFWPLKNWPVSNIADVSIVTGVALLALVVLLEEQREQAKRQAAKGGTETEQT